MSDDQMWNPAMVPAPTDPGAEVGQGSEPDDASALGGDPRRPGTRDAERFLAELVEYIAPVGTPEQLEATARAVALNGRHERAAMLRRLARHRRARAVLQEIEW